jgi:hypothetical protein
VASAAAEAPEPEADAELQCEGGRQGAIAVTVTGAGKGVRWQGGWTRHGSGATWHTRSINWQLQWAAGGAYLKASAMAEAAFCQSLQMLCRRAQKRMPGTSVSCLVSQWCARQQYHQCSRA